MPTDVPKPEVPMVEVEEKIEEVKMFASLDEQEGLMKEATRLVQLDIDEESDSHIVVSRCF